MRKQKKNDLKLVFMFRLKKEMQKNKMDVMV